MIWSFRILAFALTVAWPCVLTAQTAETPVFKKEELQQLLAPIALYPDKLLAQVLMASTYPLQIVQASRWQKDNAKLKGEAVDTALNGKDWDASVKSLVPFPQVLHMLSDKLEWTQKLGDAFLAQQADVMSEVQYLRAKAQEAGTLKSNKQQKVSSQQGPAAATGKQIIVIEPASPAVVYVPVYNPTIVYGSWWYPSYPPYYYPPPPGAAFVSGVFWGAAITASARYWGWGNCNWRGGDIDIDVDRVNNININKDRMASNKWRHEPKNRGQVPYRDNKSREQFGQKPRPAQASREARGFQPASAGARDLANTGSRDRTKSGASDQARDRARDAPKNADRNEPAGRAADRSAPREKTARAEAQKARHVERPAAKQRSGPAAFDVERGADVRAQADRGRASRQVMAQDRGGARNLDRGGARDFGGGGGRNFGGGRGGGRGGFGGGRRR